MDTSMTERSMSVMPPICIGLMVAVSPRIMRMLNTLLPMTLPMAMAERPLRAATTLVASSGSEVPPATMVRPMTLSLTCSWRATDEAESTKRLAPMTRQARPTTTHSSPFQMGDTMVDVAWSAAGSSLAVLNV